LQQRKKILKVNLLGIFNYGSVTTLFQKGTIIVDRERGDITIADQVGANRIEFTSDNFAKDSNRLRRVLAESLLITAAYRSSGTLQADAGLSSHYWFFELHQKTNLQQITDYLNTSLALQVLTLEEVNEKVKSVSGLNAFDRSTFYIDSSYDNSACRRMLIWSSS